MRLHYLIFLLIICTLNIKATNYYVSSINGKDNNDGLKPNTAWKTLYKIRYESDNYRRFQPGDSILLERGSIWRESFKIIDSGEADNPIVISAYGNKKNAKPEIRGYDELSGWTNKENWAQYFSGIWRIPFNEQCKRLWINNTEKKESGSLTLTNQYPWRKQDSYLYLKSEINPAINYSSIKLNVESTTATLHRVSGIIIENIKLSGGNTCLFLSWVDYIKVRNCEIGDKSQGYGIRIISTETNASCSHINIYNNVFNTGDSLLYEYYRGTHATSDGVLIGDGCYHIKIYDNFFWGWSHSAINIVARNDVMPLHNNYIVNNYITAPLIDYGRGIAVDYHQKGYNNYVLNNTILNTTVRCQFNGNNLKVCNNIISNTKGCPYPEKVDVGNGLSIEGYALPATNMKINNNIIRNCSDPGIYITAYNTNPKTGNHIKNNFLVNNDTLKNFQIQISKHSSINNNTFTGNFIHSGASQKAIYYGFSNSSLQLTVNEWNIQNGINNDSISNNSIQGWNFSPVYRLEK